MNKNDIISLEQNPNIGELLVRVFKTRRIYRSALARQMKLGLRTILGYQVKKTMQTDTLWKLSVALRHNFFQDISSQLPKEFATYAPVDTSREERIEALEKENELLKAQLEILERVMRK